MPGDEGNVKEATTSTTKQEPSPCKENATGEKVERSPTKTKPNSPLKPKPDVKTDLSVPLSLSSAHRSSPKKNPWTKNPTPHGEEKKKVSNQETSLPAGDRATGKDAAQLTKSIRIPKEEVLRCVCVCVCVCACVCACVRASACACASSLSRFFFSMYGDHVKVINTFSMKYSFFLLKGEFILSHARTHTHTHTHARTHTCTHTHMHAHTHTHTDV